MTPELSPTSWINQLRQHSGEESPHTDDGENQNTLIAETVSDVAAATIVILQLFRVPVGLMPFAFAVVAAAAGETSSFPCSDRVLGELALDDDTRTVEAKKKWVQRRRNEWIEWQNKTKFILIECAPGGMINDERYESRYKVHLLAFVRDCVELARTTGGNNNRENSFKSAALAILPDAMKKLAKAQARHERFNRPRQDAESRINRNLKTSLGFLKKAVETVRNSGGDPSPILEAHIREVQGLLTNEVKSVHSLDKEKLWTDLSIGSTQESHGGAVVTARPSENAGTSQSDGKVRSFGHLPDNEALIDEIKRATAEAYDALDAFVSVGATSFLVTMKDEATHEARSKKVSLREMPQAITERIEQNSHAEESLILRPNGASLIQVDDCTAAERELLAPFAFLVAETSPENFQAWIALPEETSDDDRKRIRERLFKGALLNAQANIGAGNAMRWIGSRNCKPERRGEDGSFPRVKLIQSSFARFVTEPELQDAGLLAPDVPPCDSPLPPAPEKRPMDKIVHRVHAPNYEKCLQSVARREDGKPDRSKADLHFAKLCLDWKLSFDETVALLKRVSAKAKARKDDYAVRTVRTALSRAAT
jgi:hypothetical protein